MKRFLECGQIVNTHGIAGEFKVYPWSDSPEFLLHFSKLYLDGGSRCLSVRRARVHGNMVLIQADGVDTLDAAILLKTKTIYLDRSDVSLQPGQYFWQDLEGLSVLDADSGHAYGSLTAVSQTGANDVYEVTDDKGRKFLLPAIKQVVIETNIEAGWMKIRPIKGIFDDED